MRWHFLVTDAMSGPQNMALDEALMSVARAGDAVFRVYGWSSRVISLGRHQRARGFYDLDAALRLGVSFVRRPTGGRALLHHREVTYSAVLPCECTADAAVAYNLINEVILRALRTIGVHAIRATAGAGIVPGLRPCFDVPSEHEITVDGRKLVGSAQWRHDGALLQHGAILLHDDQALIVDLLARSEPTASPSAASIVEAIGREPSTEEMASALRSALTTLTRGAVLTLPLNHALRHTADRIEATYRDDAWTWRR